MIFFKYEPQKAPYDAFLVQNLLKSPSDGKHVKIRETVENRPTL